jgi:hypothetical protein
LDPDFKIEFDFQNESDCLDEDNWDLLPTVKTCVNYIVLPLGAYGGRKEIFKERLETAMEYTSGVFDAT